MISLPYTGFSWQGLVLVLITIAFIAIMILLQPYIKKVTNTYWFWMGIGVVALAWIIAFRWVPDIKDYMEITKNGFNPEDVLQSKLCARAYFTQFCTGLFLLLTVSLIADPSRKVARSISYMTFVCGLVITIVQFMNSSARLTGWFIFLGYDDSRCFFILHWLLLTISLGVLFNTPKGGWHALVFSFIIVGIFFAYVGIVMAVTGLNLDVSGLSVRDWSEGTYSYVSKMLHMNPKYVPILTFPLMAGSVAGIWALFDYVVHRGKYKFGNAYSKCWWRWYNYNKFVKQKVL